MSSKEYGAELAQKLFKNDAENYTNITEIIVESFTKVFEEQIAKINEAKGNQNKINKTREADKTLNGCIKCSH